MSIDSTGTRIACLAMTLAYLSGQPVPVKHVQGYARGFVLLKDAKDGILATGGILQRASGTRVISTFTLRFKDGSLYEETSEYSQRKTYQLLRYKQVQKGPSFPTQKVLTLNTATGQVSIQHTEKGKTETINENLTLPPDLANGIITTLLTDADPRTERTLSLLVSTPKPRIVKLKIAAGEPDTFLLAGVRNGATRYVIKIEIGGITGVAAKVTGKQPPPVRIWIAAGNAPVFLKSEGPLFEDGPIWKIEQTSPTWPHTPTSK